MAVPDRPGVTPAGIRDGRGQELQALVALRGPAVLAYCDAVCAPSDAPRAAAEAFARFRAAVVDAGVPEGVDPDRLLLGATRHAAASLARPGRAGGGLLRRPRPTPQCQRTAGLLAARASGVLSAPERTELSRHLSRCAACQELEHAFDRAEELYRRPPERPVPDVVGEMIIAAMVAAAPVVDDEGTVELDVVDAENDAELEADAEPEADAEREADAEQEPEPEPEPDPEPADEPEAAAGVWEEPDPEEETLEDPFAPPPADGEPDDVPTGRTAAVRPQAAADREGRRVDARSMLLPGGVIALAVLVTLAVAGVFGGGEADPPVAERSSPAQRVEEPVTTPLPVELPEPPVTTPPVTTPAQPETTPVVPEDDPVAPGTGSVPAAPSGPDRAAAPQDDRDLQVDRTGSDGDAADSNSSGGTPTFDDASGAQPPG